jgi:serine acetyltransferase
MEAKEALFHQLNSVFPPSECLDKILTKVRYSFGRAYDKSISCLTKWADFHGITTIDPLHSRQYATFLSILTRQLYLSQDIEASNAVAYINKALNGCEIYGHVQIPQNFLIGHTLSIVLGQAEYGNWLCLQHNVTVGRRGESKPVIEDYVVLLNGCLVAGSSHIGRNSVIAPGVRVIDQIIPENSIAFQGVGKELIIKPNRKNIISSFLARS